MGKRKARRCCPDCGLAAVYRRKRTRDWRCMRCGWEGKRTRTYLAGSPALRKFKSSRKG